MFVKTGDVFEYLGCICDGCDSLYFKQGKREGEPRGFEKYPCKFCNVQVLDDWDRGSQPQEYGVPSKYLRVRVGKPAIPTALAKSRKEMKKEGQRRIEFDVPV